MIEPAEEDRLRRIEVLLAREDPRFAAGLERGRPRKPREYRRRTRLVLLAGLLFLVLLVLVGLHKGAAAALPLIGVAVPVMVIVALAASPRG